MVLVVVDSHSKWPEVFQMKRPTSTNTVNRLHELFARYGVVDTIVSDNGTQFTSKEFEHFCATFQVEHIRIPPYHPRSNGQAERFVNTLKRALKKAIGTPTKKALQLFLQVYRITPNKSAPSTLSPAESMFARRIRSVFDKLIPSKKSHIPAILFPRWKFNQNDKVFYKNYKNNMTTWEPGIIKERIGNMIYTVQGKKLIHRRHVNQLQNRIIDEPTETPQIEEDDQQDLYDNFDLQMPQAEQEAWVKRKRKVPPTIHNWPKKKKILKIHKEKLVKNIKKQSWVGGVGYHLPFQHNELFHLPYMAAAEISLWRICLRVRPEEPFLLLKYIIALSLILCSYY